jgi:hypothetical protein
MTGCRFESLSSYTNSPNSIRKGSKINYRGASKVRVALKKKKRIAVKISPKFEICEGKVLLELPIQTRSEANCFEPWRVKYARHKEQQRVVSLALSPHRGRITLPCKIMLTRFAPDELDAFDNLPMSFKYIVDTICAIITGNFRAGQADSDKRISIACGQEKSKAYGIRIEITY